MAKNNRGNYGGRRNGGRRSRSGYSELERLAFNLGRIHQGLDSDTKVKDSYEAGKKGVVKNKKPLC